MAITEFNNNRITEFIYRIRILKFLINIFNNIYEIALKMFETF